MYNKDQSYGCNRIHMAGGQLLLDTLDTRDREFIQHRGA